MEEWTVDLMEMETGFWNPLVLFELSIDYQMKWTWQLSNLDAELLYGPSSLPNIQGGIGKVVWKLGNWSCNDGDRGSKVLKIHQIGILQQESGTLFTERSFQIFTDHGFIQFSASMNSDQMRDF